MKIQLDTILKTIKIEENVNLGELTECLEKLLPNGLWKEFKLEAHSVIYWNNPITIQPYTPIYPRPWITYQTETAPVLIDGVYCIDTNVIN